MRQGFKKYSDMRQGYLLNPTGDIALNKRQGHATLAFLKIDRRHGDPPSRAPIMYPQPGSWRGERRGGGVGEGRGGECRRQPSGGESLWGSRPV